MPAPLIIRNLHLSRTTPFARATAIQDVLVRQHLDYKALASTRSPSDSASLPSPPIPTILTFSPTPVYTTGRRELGTLSPATISQLQEPLPVFKGRRGLDNGYANGYSPEVKETLRGGQITYHGPGQLVIYPIMDLKAVKSSKWPKGLSARCFVNVLEQATINCLKLLGIRGIRTDNPGVWVSEEEKVAAIGLHLRRNITSFGVGLNVRTDLRYFDKIVACGLEGKQTTSIKNILRSTYGMSTEEYLQKYEKQNKTDREKAKYKKMILKNKMKHIAKIWVWEFGNLVWGDEVELQRAEMSGESLGDHIATLLEPDDPEEASTNRPPTLMDGLGDFMLRWSKEGNFERLRRES